ncbi:PleD family two-component system response regulator [Roseateles sp. BYS180W]|uniref:PleD family two-component system response regulator n=1 Tax=Roseateles rivi TaxID=3299028 RepID=A0ABW7FQS2_9BURK
MNETPRILLVDDDELTLEMLKATLEGEFQPESVVSGEAAVQRCQEQSYALVLLDVDMPGMDGYETCRQLKALPGGDQLPVIFHSARLHVDERLRGYEVGGEDYLPKPFDPPELLAKIRRVLAIRERQREMAGQLDEVMNAVLVSADMVGEAGVVLEFQRQLSRCTDTDALARALHESLQRYNLDGCIRLRSARGETSTNIKGPCTALEQSILDHLQAQTEGACIQPLGPHTGFSYGSVVLFVRNLRMSREGMDRAESERMGRAIDNVALLIEGAVAKMAALESAMTARDLADVRHLVSMTTEALTDIAKRNQAQLGEVRTLFEELKQQIEDSFLHLGLTQSQEEHLAYIVRTHMESVMTVLGKSSEIEHFLSRIITKLKQHV